MTWEEHKELLLNSRDRHEKWLKELDTRMIENEKTIVEIKGEMKAIHGTVRRWVGIIAPVITAILVTVISLAMRVTLGGG